MPNKKLITILCLLSAFFGKAQDISSLHLLPLPKDIKLQTGSFRLTENFTVSIHESTADTILVKAVNRMYQTLNRRSGAYFKQRIITSKDNSDTASLQVTVGRAVLPTIGADESYSLTITNDKVILNAPTTLGALHGLETILQLLAKNNTGEFYFPAVTIQDAPRFQWRGLMLDVSRHFIPVDVIKRNIEAMAAVKMNVLHWHLTDDEGFRVESKTFPQLHGKGSNGDYYTQAQIKDMIAFAEERGIIIVPEFDMPGHTRSWFAGYPQLASAPGPYVPGPRYDIHKAEQMTLNSIIKLITTSPSPTIDPTKETTYEFIDKFIAEMSSLFTSPFIHIGADENNGVAWKNNPSIAAFMKAHAMATPHELQAYFVRRVNKIITKHHRQMIGWEELLSKDLAKDVTVQVWQNGAFVKQAIDNGNPVLISKGFYLDIFMPAYIHYNNPELPAEVAGERSGQLRGGEAAQWTEMADRTNIETRVWPRAAAVAEKLWSTNTTSDIADLYRRIFSISGQLDDLGLQHVVNYERALRRYTNEKFPSLKTFTDVLTPVKGYKKIFAQLTMPESMTYQTAPLTQISDIIFVDSKVKWKFRVAVESYLKQKDTAAENLIRSYLIQWQNNYEQIKDLFTNSQLKRVEEHSKNLSLVATIGLEALNKLKDETTDANWVNEKLSILKTASQVYGETELCIISEIESLVKQQMTALPVSYPIF